MYVACNVYTLRLDTIDKTVNGKRYTSHLLRQACRDGGKVRHRTIANLTGCAPQEGTFHYITAITKPQIASRLKKGQLQLGLFEEQRGEVTDAEDGVRYVLRRNPLRAAELAAGRQEKLETIQQLLAKQNTYLTEHPHATVAAAIRRVQRKIAQLRLSGRLSIAYTERTLTLTRNENARHELSKLDGCYCLKTDLSVAQAAKELVHERYKALAEVEWAFHASKSALEVRPIFVRTESRTRGHVFVVVLAYYLVKELGHCWRELELTPREGVHELATLCVTEVTLKNQTTINQVPTPRESVQQRLTAAHVAIPPVLP